MVERKTFLEFPDVPAGDLELDSDSDLDTDADSDAALAMPADAGPEARAFIAAMQSKMEQLQRKVAAMEGPRPQIDDDDDDARGFGSVDDDASSQAPLIVAPSLALSREVNQLFEALAAAKEPRLWRTHKVARTLDSLHKVARNLSIGDGDALQLRTQRSVLVGTLRRQLSRAAFVGDTFTYTSFTPGRNPSFVRASFRYFTCMTAVTTSTDHTLHHLI